MALTVNFNLEGNTLQANDMKLVRQGDGDTLAIEQPVRLVSVDTPEKNAYAGGPDKSQPKLDRARGRLESGFYNALPKPLRTYLLERLTPDAAAHHIEAADAATQAFDEILARRLSRGDGGQRKLAVMPAGEIIDRNGRMLVYLAPWFANDAKDPLPPKGDPERQTFNLDMIRSGWGAFFPIYPSLPGDYDFNLAIEAAETAWDDKLGAWDVYGSTILLGYEFRACIKLAGPLFVARQAGKDNRNFYTPEEYAVAKDGLTDWDVEQVSAADLIGEAFARHCVDLRTRKDLGKFGFPSVPPCYRLWFWEDALTEATRELGLVP